MCYCMLKTAWILLFQPVTTTKKPSVERTPTPPATKGNKVSRRVVRSPQGLQPIYFPLPKVSVKQKDPNRLTVEDLPAIREKVSIVIYLLQDCCIASYAWKTAISHLHVYIALALFGKSNPVPLLSMVFTQCKGLHCRGCKYTMWKAAVHNNCSYIFPQKFFIDSL